jgi:Fur family transcriptional regulator, peroxide stress response regulator
MKKEQKTAQRLAILDYLKDNKSHPSIKEIYQHVSDKIYNISLTTVYNTIDLLKDKGIVMELPIVIHGEGRRFDPNPVPHDHLICNKCGAVVDIEGNVYHSSLLSEKQQHGFDIKAISVNVYGICPGCKNIDISPN